MPPIVIEGPRLILRTPEVEDAAAHVYLFTNPANLEHEVNNTRQPTVAQYESRIKRFQEDTESGKSAFMVIELPSLTGNEQLQRNGNVIGSGGFNEIVVRDGLRVGNTGVLIDSSEWGQGYGTEVVTMTVDYGFGSMGLDVIQLETLAKNAAMRAVLERKFGLAGTEKDGEHGREVLYEIRKQDWLERS